MSLPDAKRRAMLLLRRLPRESQVRFAVAVAALAALAVELTAE